MKPSIEEKAGDGVSDRPQLARCPGYQYRSVICHAPYPLAPIICLIISNLQHTEGRVDWLFGVSKFLTRRLVEEIALLQRK